MPSPAALLPELERKDSEESSRGGIFSTEIGSLCAIGLAAFLVRFFFYLLSVHEPITSDGVYYAWLGKHLLSGDANQGLSTYWPPLYPLLIGITSIFFSDLEQAGVFVSLVAGSLLTLPAFLLSRTFYGRRVAVLTAVLIITYPVLVHYSTLVLTESTYSFLFLSAILTGWYAQLNWNPRAALATGLLFGACYLVKPEAIAYIFLVAAVILAATLRGRLAWGQGAKSLALLSVGAFLIAAPYLIYLRSQTGRWILSEKISLYLTLEDEHEDTSWRTLLKGERTTFADIVYAGEKVRRQAGEQKETSPIPTISLLPFVQYTIKGTLYSAVTLYKLIARPFIVFAILGLLSALWWKDQEIYLLLFICASLVGYGIQGMLAEQRYLLPLLPLIFCWVAKGLEAFASLLSSALQRIFSGQSVAHASRRFVGPALAGLLVLYLTAPRLAQARAKNWNPDASAAWLKKDSATPTPIIMASGSWLAFYTKGKHVYLPDAEYPEVIKYARERAANYLVIEERFIETTPKLKFLLDDDRDQLDLSLAFRDVSVPHFKVLIFKLKKEAAAAAD